MKLFNNRKKTISTYISTIFLLFAFMSIFISITFVYIQAFRITKSRKMEALKLSGEFISRSIDAQIRIMERTAKILLGNISIQNALIDIQKLDESSFLQKEALTRFISNQIVFSTLMKDSISIEFYSSNRDILHKSPYRRLSEENLLDTLKSPDQLYLSHYQIVPPSEHEITNDRGNTFCMLIHPMKYLYQDEPVAFIVILLDTSKLGKILKQNAEIINDGKKIHCTIYLEDANSKIVTSNDNQIKSIVRNKNSNYIEILSEYTKWKTVIEIPNLYFFSDMFLVQTFNIVILLILLLSTAYGIRVLLEKKLYVFRKLIAAMGSVKKGNYSIELNVENLDEDIKQVFEHFNEMSREIDDLINRVYRSRLLAKEAQLKMLELQINPHFLYNSLQTIEAYGELHDHEEIQIMASSLGSLLRYNLKANAFVSLKQELDMVKKYCRIEQIRFKERVHIFINADDRLLKMIIPKFILQPIIENCFIHAFPPDSENGIISVQCIMHDEDMLLSISDNGIGIKAEKMAKINENLENIDKSVDQKVYFDHIGLSNINYRIKTYYGEVYGIRIQEGLEQGLTVLISLPCNEGMFGKPKESY